MSENTTPLPYELHPDVVAAQAAYSPAKLLHEKCAAALSAAVADLNLAAPGDAQDEIAEQVKTLEAAFKASGKAMQAAQDALHAALQKSLAEAHPELISLQTVVTDAEAALAKSQAALIEAQECGDDSATQTRLAATANGCRVDVNRARREVARYVTKEKLG